MNLKPVYLIVARVIITEAEFIFTVFRVLLLL